MDATAERPVLDPSQPGGAGDTQVIGALSPDTVDNPAVAPSLLRLDFHAVSDVGRVRKDNQDSGYAGPWLLAVCDGVGGAARGDIASSTAINELRQLDEPAGSVDLVERVNDGLHEAHVSIGSQVDHDPSLNGTSTTATVALFDGHRLALGHVGDSRAYLLRDGEISQLTNDHTFVQSLIDEGRITPEEARVHPHRNLILKALDGLHDVEPDLFALELVVGDRLFLCSDGACGVLEDHEIAALLTDTTPEAAATELVRASLDAGSSDNVTCVVADVLDGAAADGVTAAPVVVGAAAELKQRRRPLFRGRNDTGEIEPIDADIPEGLDHAIPEDPLIDPEAMRYAPQAPPRFVWGRRAMVLVVLIGMVWIALGTAYWWSQQQYYIGEDDGRVVIFQGVNVPGLNHVHERSDVVYDDLPMLQQEQVDDMPDADDADAARERIERIAQAAAESEESGDDLEEPPASPAPTAPSESVSGAGNGAGLGSGGGSGVNSSRDDTTPTE
ncbi:serine/threonine-protein phosphatase [Nocardioides caeni]|uniref:Serine/threonine-protein phosphatase n=2 Tax=Nocardioides caeni TaxID=574700 RepID=A0A4S8N4N8_9ACTN|nr:serine/threonine-protein phosphatase [Nocardioides caeni]